MREITGRHVLLIIGGGFAVIIAVNVALAVAAIRTFPGLEVPNSYVASQVFDAERKAQERLGWEVGLSYREGRLRLAFTDAEGPVQPEIVSAVLGRATIDAQDIEPAFAPDGDALAAEAGLDPGLWVLRFVARADDGTLYRRRLEVQVGR